MTRWNDARRRNRLGCQSHSEKTLCMTGFPPLKRHTQRLFGMALATQSITASRVIPSGHY
jgi:hypothetical protein